MTLDEIKEMVASQIEGVKRSQNITTEEASIAVLISVVSELLEMNKDLDERLKTLECGQIR